MKEGRPRQPQPRPVCSLNDRREEERHIKQGKSWFKVLFLRLKCLCWFCNLSGGFSLTSELETKHTHGFANGMTDSHHYTWMQLLRFLEKKTTKALLKLNPDIANMRVQKLVEILKCIWGPTHLLSGLCKKLNNKNNNNKSLLSSVPYVVKTLLWSPGYRRDVMSWWCAAVVTVKGKG